jgi:hypothetical protein
MNCLSGDNIAFEFRETMSGATAKSKRTRRSLSGSCEALNCGRELDRATSAYRCLVYLVDQNGI